MSRKWIEAGGEYRVPFMGAMSRIYRGDYHVLCPKCGLSEVRFYYQTINRERNTGTFYVWCASCHTVSHVPRQTPPAFHDPLHELDLSAVGAPGEGLYDLVNRLWEERQILAP